MTTPSKPLFFRIASGGVIVVDSNMIVSIYRALVNGQAVTGILTKPGLEYHVVESIAGVVGKVYGEEAAKEYVAFEGAPQIYRP